MSAAVSFYDQDTGLFHSHWIGPESQLKANMPPNCKHIAGHHPLYGSKVDLETGQVVDHVPASPSPDHEWNAEQTRYVWSDAALARHSALAQIQRLEASQHRPQRELTLNPANAEARKHLELIDAQIATLRGTLGGQ